jgi:hypothetical protein
MHIKFAEDIAVIKNCIQSIKGTKAIATATLITVILSIIGLAVVWGETKNQVSVNSRRLDIVESLLHRAQAKTP